jgi:hypothetical protein
LEAYLKGIAATIFFTKTSIFKSSGWFRVCCCG